MTCQCAGLGGPHLMLCTSPARVPWHMCRRLHHHVFPFMRLKDVSFAAETNVPWCSTSEGLYHLP